MALVFEIAASLLVALIFIIVAIVSHVLAWPIWIVMVTFFLLFILSSVGLAYLIIALRPSKNDDEEDES